jgi:hypothetical protein
MEWEYLIEQTQNHIEHRISYKQKQNIYKSHSYTIQRTHRGLVDARKQNMRGFNSFYGSIYLYCALSVVDYSVNQYLLYIKDALEI